MRSPATMQTPIEFIAAGRLVDGEIAQSVSAATIGRVDAKIAEWKQKAGASRKSGEALWAQPGSKKVCCVAVKWGKAPKWPATDYYTLGDANPAFACPLCVGSFTPCVWTHKDVAAEARILSLPPQERLAPPLRRRVITCAYSRSRRHQSLCEFCIIV